jgi:hypothetical protein
MPPPQQQPAAGRNGAMSRATMMGAGCGHAMYATGYCTKIWLRMWRLTNTKKICAHDFWLTEWMHRVLMQSWIRCDFSIAVFGRHRHHRRCSSRCGGRPPPPPLIGHRCHRCPCLALVDE